MTLGSFLLSKSGAVTTIVVMATATRTNAVTAFISEAHSSLLMTLMH